MSLPRTPSQTVGPYYAIGLCRRPDDELDPDGIELTGRLLDGQGEPIVDGVLEAFVFARGLLRHQRTRIYLRDTDDEVLARLDPSRRSTLLAHRESDALRFDIRMQGERATVFFAH